MENADKNRSRVISPAINEAEQEADRLFDESRRLLSQAGAEPDPAKSRQLSERAHELGERSQRLQRVAAKLTRVGVKTAVHR